VRLSIANYETLIANALRRAMRHRDGQAVPRISDLRALYSSMMGKLEFEYASNNRSEDEIVDELIKRSVLTVFDSVCGETPAHKSVIDAFNNGWMVELTDMSPCKEFVEGMDKIEGLRAAALQVSDGDSAPRIASAIEFILEGLHLHNKLNKVTSERGVAYGQA
jgi:magnesium chelatase subunit I